MSMRILVIDNFDSFTYNLVNLLAEVKRDAHFKVVRNNVSLGELVDSNPECLVVSPGPGSPFDSGVSTEAIDYFMPRIPLFGVCLGLLCLNQCTGGSFKRCETPTHGKTSLVEHEGFGLFEQVPNPLRVMRYHSLQLDQVSESLQAVAYTDDIPMAVVHKNHPAVAVQFHPESFLSEQGEQILKNFFRYYG